MSTIEDVKADTEKILHLLTQNPKINNNMDQMIETLEKCKKMFGNITIEQAILEFDIIRRM